jgi:hypothetical protein
VRSRANTHECTGLKSASLEYYPDFLITPFGESCPFVGFLAHRTGAKPYLPNFALTEF